MQCKLAVLFCAAADVSSSTRLSEGEDAESSETASVEGQGKAATSINWMHVRCRSLHLFSIVHSPGLWRMIQDWASPPEVYPCARECGLCQVLR